MILTKKLIYSALQFMLSIGAIFFSNTSFAEFDDSYMFVNCVEQFENVTDLAKPLSFEEGYCLGFIQSLQGANKLVKNNNIADAFCAPENVTEMDLLRTIIHQVNLDPELKSFPDRYLLSQRALKRAYPCTLFMLQVKD